VSYAVLWKNTEGTLFAGGLVFERDRLVLDGASRGRRRTTLELAYSEIEQVSVGRGQDERIDGRSSLIIELHGGRRLLVTSATGAGMNHDIAEQLSRVRGRLRRR
jgi:hypothetical protein